MENNTAAIAAVSALVATGVTLVANHVAQKRNAAAVQAAVSQAWINGDTTGYYRGRDDLMQEWAASATPQKFAPAE